MVLERTLNEEREVRISKFRALLKQRIIILDCAMGTMIQRYGLGEEDYRGERFKNYPRELKGNNDLLSITQPQIIQDIHNAVLEVGADKIETNTLNTPHISQAQCEIEYVVHD